MTPVPEGIRRACRGALMTCLILIIACGVAESALSAKPGDLDRSFGRQGRAMTATAPQMGELPEFGGGMTWAARGRIVVAGGRTVVEYLPNGRLNRDFGKHGRLTMRSPSGVRFRPEAIATDSKGRVLVAGTSTPTSANGTPGPQQLPGPSPSWATVTRYLPDGRRDLSFGNNGTVNSTLGLPPPRPTTGLSGSEPFEYQTPSVKVTGLAVDIHDRAVITGVFVEHVTLCYPGIGVGWHGSYVARLTVSGSMDQAFHGSGLLQIPDLAEVSQPMLASGDRILYTSLVSTQCRRGSRAGPAALNALTSDGQPDMGFDTDGYAVLDQPEPWALTVGGRGKIFVAGPILEGSEEYGEDLGFRVVRISPDGQRDIGFGQQGFGVVPRWMSVAALAIDRRGRILLAGSAFTDPPSRSRFVLARMKRSGEMDRSFGQGGSVKTGFGISVFAIATQILIDPQNRIVVGGGVFSSPRFATGNGVAAVRYLNGGK
jgi:uncharacterized delta-60 repeat protein